MTWESFERLHSEAFEAVVAPRLVRLPPRPLHVKCTEAQGIYVMARLLPSCFGDSPVVVRGFLFMSQGNLRSVDSDTSREESDERHDKSHFYDPFPNFFLQRRDFAVSQCSCATDSDSTNCSDHKIGHIATKNVFLRRGAAALKAKPRRDVSTSPCLLGERRTQDTEQRTPSPGPETLAPRSRFQHACHAVANRDV